MCDEMEKQLLHVDFMRILTMYGVQYNKKHIFNVPTETVTGGYWFGGRVEINMFNRRRLEFLQAILKAYEVED